MTVQYSDPYRQRMFLIGIINGMLITGKNKPAIQRYLMEEQGVSTQEEFEDVYQQVRYLMDAEDRRREETSQEYFFEDFCSLEPENPEVKEAREQGMILGRMMLQIENGIAKPYILIDAQKKYNLSFQQFEKLYREAWDRVEAS